jgi:hypothetical protein
MTQKILSIFKNCCHQTDMSTLLLPIRVVLPPRATEWGA